MNNRACHIGVCDGYGDGYDGEISVRHRIIIFLRLIPLRIRNDAIIIFIIAVIGYRVSDEAVDENGIACPEKFIAFEMVLKYMRDVLTIIQFLNFSIIAIVFSQL